MAIKDWKKVGKDEWEKIGTDNRIKIYDLHNNKPPIPSGYSVRKINFVRPYGLLSWGTEIEFTKTKSQALAYANAYMRKN